DGIRDRNVTGVQTCALPIFFGFGGTDLLRALRNSIGRLLTWYGPLTRSRTVQPGQGTSFRGSCPPRSSKGLSSSTSARDEATREIGRASCREREESAGRGAV